MHIDQPPFLTRTLLNAREPKLLIYFIIESHLFEPLCKLSAIILPLRLCICWRATAPSSPASPASKRIGTTIPEARIASSSTGPTAV